jgi:hypothetical protein
MNIIQKVFIMLMGVVFLVLLFFIIDSISTQTCVPEDIYDNQEVGSFGGGFINALYDSMCNSLLNANNAVWGAYTVNYKK